MNCFQRTHDTEPPAVLWLIIGCKGNHSISINQIHTQFFLLSLLNALELIAASFVAPARKVRIRLRPITGVIRGLSVNERIRSFKGWYERQIRTATHTFSAAAFTIHRGIYSYHPASIQEMRGRLPPVHLYNLKKSWENTYAFWISEIIVRVRCRRLFNLIYRSLVDFILL